MIFRSPLILQRRLKHSLAVFPFNMGTSLLWRHCFWSGLEGNARWIICFPRLVENLSTVSILVLSLLAYNALCSVQSSLASLEQLSPHTSRPLTSKWCYSFTGSLKFHNWSFGDRHSIPSLSCREKWTGAILRSSVIISCLFIYKIEPMN